MPLAIPPYTHHAPRLCELDWVRVFVILAVFLHHTAMPFSGAPWLIVNAQSSQAVNDFMMVFDEVRLPTLFMVAGVGSSLLLARRTNGAFFIDKLRRLGVPLAVGVVFIVPPQLYFSQKDQLTNFWAAYPQLLSQFDLLHLWFIGYLIVFSVMVIPIAEVMRLSRVSALIDQAVPYLTRPSIVLSMGIVLIAARIFLPTPTLYLFFFLAGHIMGSRPTIWFQLKYHWQSYLLAFCCAIILFYTYYFGIYDPQLTSATRWSSWWLVTSTVSWTGALAILSTAQRFLSTTPAWLKEANALSYPFFILHQTAIVIIGYYVIPLSAGIAVKLLLLISSSFIITAGLCRFVIAPLTPLRILFGLKLKSG